MLFGIPFHLAALAGFFSRKRKRAIIDPAIPASKPKLDGNPIRKNETPPAIGPTMINDKAIKIRLRSIFFYF